MSSMPNDFNSSTQPPVAKKSNKKLIITIVIIVVLGVLICCGGLIALPFFGIYMVKGTAESSVRQALVQSKEAKDQLGDISEVSFSFESTTKAASKHPGEQNWFGCVVKGTESTGDVYVHLGPDLKSVLSAELILQDGTTIPLTVDEDAELQFEAPSAPTETESATE